MLFQFNFCICFLNYLHCLFLYILKLLWQIFTSTKVISTNIHSVVGSSVSPNKESSQKYLVLFQILVTLVTISDWPWWVSWQHFYSQSLPTKKLQATLPISLPCGHATPIYIHWQFFCFVDLQKNRCMRKELKSSDLCLRPKSAAPTFSPTEILPNDARPILSTTAPFPCTDVYGVQLYLEGLAGLTHAFG